MILKVLASLIYIVISGPVGTPATIFSWFGSVSRFLEGVILPSFRLYLLRNQYFVSFDFTEIFHALSSLSRAYRRDVTQPRRDATVWLRQDTPRG